MYFGVISRKFLPIPKSQFSIFVPVIHFEFSVLSAVCAGSLSSSVEAGLSSLYLEASAHGTCCTYLLPALHPKHIPAPHFSVTLLPLSSIPPSPCLHM